MPHLPRSGGVDPSAHLIDCAALCLGVTLVAIKVPFMGIGAGWTAWEVGDLLTSTAAITYADVTLVATAWATARALLLLLPVGPLSGLVATGFACLSLVAALLAVIDVGVFGVLGGFVTYPMLLLIGNVRMLRSSVDTYLTAPAIAGVIGIPLLTLAATWFAHRRSLLAATSTRRRIAVAAGAWVLVGLIAYDVWWATRQERRIAQSAHWVLVSSWWARHAGDVVRLDERFDPADLADFAPIGATVAGPPARPATPGAGVRYASSKRPGQPRRPPSVVFVVLESVGARWTSLGAHGYQTTPTLATEAAHGVVFDNFYAHIGRSSNSLSALLMSVNPKLGFRDMTEEYPTLQGTSVAGLLRGHGYRTGFITSSELAWASWDRFLDGRGFDEVRDKRHLPCGKPISSWGVEDRCLVDDMVRWMDDAPERPFFLMTWTQQTHHPYEPSPGIPLLPLARDQVVDYYAFHKYLNVVHETDRQLARVFDAVRRSGRADDTVIVVTGDHGQGFGFPHDSYMQGRRIYEEDVRVPLLIWAPGLYPMPERSPVIGSHVDLGPTIAALVGAPPAPEWQGRSLFAPNRVPRAYFYVAEDEFMLGMRDDRWKYILDVRDGSQQLFDLATDPEEQRNVAAEHPDVCGRLRQRLAAWTEANRRQYEPGSIPRM